MQSNPEHSDDYYIHRILDGDTDAFRVLVKRHKDKSFTVAFGIVSNHELAQDVVQEAFVRAYKGLRLFKGEAQFSTWLHTIVVRLCYNQLKKKKYASLDTDTWKSQNLASQDIDGLKTQDQKAYINKALEALKPDEALVLRLFYLTEMSIKEIQRATKFSPSKIRVDLHRGRVNLNRAMETLLGKEKNNLL